jgi:phytoene dehydrogenase-like protein
MAKTTRKAMQNAKIIILGGGVAGLIAARELEARGYTPILLEASDRPGGRVKTDIVDGFVLDHGFQVLLTAYREAQRYLDYSALDLRRFRPGALIINAQRQTTLVDPLREPQHLLTALFGGVGSLRDKFLVWRLRQQLKRQELEAIFSASRQDSSIQFLRDYGFSEAMIEGFFRPFFGGIFLENELSTSSAMLRFVFRLFAEGDAAVPAAGIEAIPQQLQAGLQHTTLHCNTRVTEVGEGELRTDSGDRFTFDALIVATDPGGILPQLAGQTTDYQQTTNFYFATEEPLLRTRLIALVDEPASILNNFHEVDTLGDELAPQGQHLISVTLKDIPTAANAEVQVMAELRRLAQRPNWKLRPVGRYDIPRALPKLDQLQYTYSAMQSRLTDRIFLAGDHLLMGSLDAAMRSGRLAAEAVTESLVRLGG